MPRMAGDASLTISRLEAILDGRRQKLASLQKERSNLVKELQAVDEKIAQISGGKIKGNYGGNGGVGTAGTTTPGGRVRNEKSLVELLDQVLSKTGEPMKVGDIVEAVLKAGYNTTSANFRGIVNQTLIKEKQFTQAGRGLYGVKK